MPQPSKLLGEVAPFCAIWAGRFTVPKVLGSMVRIEKRYPINWTVPQS
jgi:hypothetical protein